MGLRADFAWANYHSIIMVTNAVVKSQVGGWISLLGVGANAAGNQLWCPGSGYLGAGDSPQHQYA